VAIDSSDIALPIYITKKLEHRVEIDTELTKFDRDGVLFYLVGVQPKGICEKIS